MLLISIILSAVSLLARPPKSPRGIPSKSTLDRALSRVGLTKTRDDFNVALIVRLPLLVIAVHQQIFARPSAPYMLGSGMTLVDRQRTSPIVVSVVHDALAGTRSLYQDSLVVGGVASHNSRRGAISEP